MRVSLGWVVLLMMACPGAATPAQPRPALQPGRRALGQARRQLRTAAVICCQQTALAWDRQAPAGGAGEDAGSRRRRTAREVLDIMAGARLQNKSREAALRAATHPLPLRAALADWDALAANASRRGASAVASALTAETCAVPDVEGAAGCRCQLTTQPRARRFRRATRLNGAAAALFEAIASGSSDRRLPAVALDRFDLFHAHMFLARRAPGRAPGLGLLFHAKEYPRRSAAFPVNLGFCQANSTLAFDQRAMDLRNLVFYQGALCALDVGEGSPLHDDLLMDGLQDVRTVLETDFGDAVCDVNYFHSLPGLAQERVYICGGGGGGGAAAAA